VHQKVVLNLFTDTGFTDTGVSSDKHKLGAADTIRLVVQSLPRVRNRLGGLVALNRLPHFCTKQQAIGHVRRSTEPLVDVVLVVTIHQVVVRILVLLKTQDFNLARVEQDSAFFGRLLSGFVVVEIDNDFIKRIKVLECVDYFFLGCAGRHDTNVRITTARHLERSHRVVVALGDGDATTTSREEILAEQRRRGRVALEPELLASHTDLVG